MRNYSGNELWKILGKASPRKNAEEAGRLGSLRRRLECDWGGHKEEPAPWEGLPLPFSHTHSCAHQHAQAPLTHEGYLGRPECKLQSIPRDPHHNDHFLENMAENSMDWCILLGNSPASWPEMCTLGSFPSGEASVLSQIYFSLTCLFTSFSPFLSSPPFLPLFLFFSLHLSYFSK